MVITTKTNAATTAGISSTPNNKGVDEFFSFYSQLQQSSQYYSTLALRQMLVGYQNLVGIGTSENCLLPVMSMNKMSGATNNPSNKVGGMKPSTLLPGKRDSSSLAAFCTPPPKTPQQAIKVVVSNYESDSDDNNQEQRRSGLLPRQRKVNFATPLSTIKMKSPTPMHSMEELNGGHNLDPGRTGFTSDSEMEGSETDIWCQYIWRVRNVEQKDQLQVPSSSEGDAAETGKKRKKRRKKKNKNAKPAAENTDEEYNYDHYDEDDANAIFEVPLNEDDYEFISEIRRCGTAEEAKETVSQKLDNSGETGNAQESGRRNEMKFLYGDSGSARIIKMEDTIDDCFKQAMKKVELRKYYNK